MMCQQHNSVKFSVKRTVLKLVALATAFAFLFTTSGIEPAYSASLASVTPDTVEIQESRLDFETFILPKNLGVIKENWISPNGGKQ